MRLFAFESCCYELVATLRSGYYSVQLDFCVYNSGSLLCKFTDLSTGAFFIVADDLRFSFAEDTYPDMGGLGDLILFLSYFDFLLACDFVAPFSFLLLEVRFSAALLEVGFSIAAAEELVFVLSLFMD